MNNSQKDAKDESPTIGEQAELDSAATILVKQWLPLGLGWIVRERRPDIFIDYEIERVEAKEPTGKFFYAQQKAHRSISSDGPLIAETLKTKHLRYYAQCEVPVFLFAVDVGSTIGYWLFLQEWLDQEALGKRLTDQETITVKVPKANLLSDHPSLLSAVRKAGAYMREKFPGSVEAAIKNTIERLTAIDPRFDIKLDIVNSQKRFSLNPLQPISVKLKISGDKVTPFRELFEYGRPFELTGGGIEFEDFPLFEAMSPKGAVAGMGFAPTEAPHCTLEFWIEEQPDSSRLQLEGHLTRGSAGLLYVGKLKGAPLSVEIKIPSHLLSSPGTATMTVSWNWSIWSGIGIDSLPYFEPLHALIQAAAAGMTINHKFSFQGGKLTRGKLGRPDGNSPFAAPGPFLEALSRARTLAKTFGVRPVLPAIDSLTEDDFQQIDFAYAIAHQGGFVVESSTLTLSLVLNTLEKESLAVLVNKGAGSALKMSHAAQSARIFGTEIDLGPLDYLLSPAKVIVDSEKLQKAVNGQIDELPVELVADGMATYSVKRANS